MVSNEGPDVVPRRFQVRGYGDRDLSGFQDLFAGVELSGGLLCDLDAFFQVIQGLLKPGGKLVMEEMHPVLLMYEPNTETGISTIEYSYFSRQIWRETNGLDYYSGDEYDSAPNYSFMHRLDEILMAGIHSGLALRSFKELDYDISFFCSDLEDSPTKPPLGFVMVMDNGGD